jgi:hypothetical protein
MALGSTQPLTEMSTRNLPGGKGRPERTDDLTVTGGKGRSERTADLTPICEPIV